jgi:hypothetical protein
VCLSSPVLQYERLAAAVGVASRGDAWHSTAHAPQQLHAAGSKLVGAQSTRSPPKASSFGRSGQIEAHKKVPRKSIRATENAQLA